MGRLLKGLADRLAVLGNPMMSERAEGWASIAATIIGAICVVATAYRWGFGASFRRGHRIRGRRYCATHLMGQRVDLENCHALAVVGRRSLPPGRCNNFGRCRHRHLASVDP